MNTLVENDTMEILRLAIEARLDSQCRPSYVARAKAIARRIGCPEHVVESLPKYSALRAELELRKAMVLWAGQPA